MRLTWVAAAALAVLGVVGVVACGDDGAGSADPASPATIEGSVVITPTPAPPATPTPPGTPTPAPPEPSPRVLWMTVDHAGPGAATVRVATDVPTTAKLTLYGPGDTAITNVEPPDRSDTLTELHTFSVALPTVHTAYIADVFSAQGVRASAFLERGAINGEEYFQKGEMAPKLTMQAERNAVAAWVAPRRGAAIVPGEAVVLRKEAGCTTAQACLAEPVGTFGDDRVGESEGRETHGVRVRFPDRESDYQVVIVGKFPANSPLRGFYQFDVTASEIQ